MGPTQLNSTLVVACNRTRIENGVVAIDVYMIMILRTAQVVYGCCQSKVASESIKENVPCLKAYSETDYTFSIPTFSLPGLSCSFSPRAAEIS